MTCRIVFAAVAAAALAAGVAWGGDDAQDRAKNRYRLSRTIAEESFALLKNDGTLPLAKGSKVKFFGPVYGKWMTCGGFSCIVDAPYSIGPAEGLANAGLVLDDAAKDIAVWLVCRDNGRGGEPDLNAYQLKPEELAMLAEIKKAGFSKIIVVLNTGIACSTREFRDDPAVAGMVLVGFPGMEGGNALGRILVGDVNPSGRLSRTLAAKSSDYPADANWQDSRQYVPYEDDIFVGYRYFETIPGAAAKVVYPFGYGLSYTTFALKDAAAELAEDVVRVKVSVVNTGKVAGKRSVLAYSSVQGGSADHAARELRGFAKTRLLQPGEQETLEIAFGLDQLAYFDDEGTSGKIGSWVLDGGEYTIWVGGDVRDTVKAGSFTLEEKILSTPGFKLNPARLARRLRADGSVTSEPVVYGDANGQKATVKFPLKPSKKKIMFQDVAEGRATVDDFIDQLDLPAIVKLLSGGKNLVKGADTCSIGLLEEYGAPGLQTADGPLGVRFNQGIKSTQFPATDITLGSFNVELAEQFGRAMGEEAREKGVDILLAPGVNLSRHPTCAREIEFMGEDPCLAGLMSAAEIRGVQSQGVAATIKHFFANNRINSCKNYMSVLSERAAREIYMRQFEIAVKTAAPMCVMTAYNGANGRHAGANWGAIEGILRGEWNFQGLVMTDWDAQSLMWQEIACGNDVKMPSDGGGAKYFMSAARGGLIDPAMIRKSLKRVLALELKLKPSKPK